MPVLLTIGPTRAQGPAAVPADQWPNYHHNSNFSPLTQITPANVSRLTKAWTLNYGVGSTPTWITSQPTLISPQATARSSESPSGMRWVTFAPQELQYLIKDLQVSSEMPGMRS